MAATYTTREEHPLPAVLIHWTHLVSMLVLIFTGFYIHGPFLFPYMDIMRNLHFVFMFVLIYTAIVRVYWAFFGAGSAEPGSRRRIRDYKFFGPQPENKGTLWPTLSYYLFLRKDRPSTSKYNPLQKGTYVLWLFLIAAVAITGFELWTPTAPALLPLTYFLGGVMWVRTLHYWIMWLFIITTAIHIYLSILYPKQIALMFAWRESGGASQEGGAPPAGSPKPAGPSPAPAGVGSRQA